ncbi:TetR family transcriptional regulator [Duganella sp. FT135W]|uniref:TetR family transcriptional regulator n=2 Tax=Duganella flavida TaxID=2692175 RepID=A0A6L8KNW9_9BURK|nr:TetR family transcriptional regulator [Duganella flavida]
MYVAVKWCLLKNFTSTMPKSDTAPAAKSTAKTQLTPEDWIHAAGQVLVNKSIDAVRVDALSKDLGVTRGSFYWHFKDREDLLRQLLVSWRDRATEQIIDRFERRNTKPRELIRELLMLPFHGSSAKVGASTELAIRAWARRDEMARHFVDEVDGKRLAYISQCFSGLGFDIPESRTRAFMLYSFMLAESLLSEHGAQTQHEERQRSLERMLVQMPAAESPGASD